MIEDLYVTNNAVHHFRNTRCFTGVSVRGTTLKRCSFILDASKMNEHFLKRKNYCEA